MNHNRREFLAEVGKGMLVSSLGTSLATDLGIGVAIADDSGKRLSFGSLEPLVALVQETPTQRILQVAVDRLQSGTSLRDLVTATAMANARTFGGSNYDGYHSFMAISPAFQMANELPKERQALPVLKVLYRNSRYITGAGGAEHEKLHPLHVDTVTDHEASGRQMREAIRQYDVESAERSFASIADGSPENALNDLLQYNIEEHPGVHEIVLVWRAWEMVDFVGREHAHTLLRQSVRQNIADRAKPQNLPKDPQPNVIANLIDRHRIGIKPLGKRSADDAWIERMVTDVLSSRPDQAAEIVASALVEGFSPEHVGEALALCANQLLLRQVESWPEGYGHRTHGDSMGVHASDAVNAWRNVGRVSNPRNQAASLMLAANLVSNWYHWSDSRKIKAFEKDPYPTLVQVEAVKATDPAILLRDLDGAIRENNQFGACAIVKRYGDLGLPARPVFDVLLRYAISEDGRLHGEKYYRTVREEFESIRPAFRWRELVALARVTASAYGYTREDSRGTGTGYRAPGYEEACKLLRI